MDNNSIFKNQIIILEPKNDDSLDVFNESNLKNTLKSPEQVLISLLSNFKATNYYTNRQNLVNLSNFIKNNDFNLKQTQWILWKNKNDNYDAICFYNVCLKDDFNSDTLSNFANAYLDDNQRIKPLIYLPDFIANEQDMNKESLFANKNYFLTNFLTTLNSINKDLMDLQELDGNNKYYGANLYTSFNLDEYKRTIGITKNQTAFSNLNLAKNSNFCFYSTQGFNYLFIDEDNYEINDDLYDINKPVVYTYHNAYFTLNPFNINDASLKHVPLFFKDALSLNDFNFSYKYWKYESNEIDEAILKNDIITDFKKDKDENENDSFIPVWFYLKDNVDMLKQQRKWINLNFLLSKTLFNQVLCSYAVITSKTKKSLFVKNLTKNQKLDVTLSNSIYFKNINDKQNIQEVFNFSMYPMFNLFSYFDDTFKDFKLVLAPHKKIEYEISYKGTHKNLDRLSLDLSSLSFGNARYFKLTPKSNDFLQYAYGLLEYENNVIFLIQKLQKTNLANNLKMLKDLSVKISKITLEGNEILKDDMVQINTDLKIVGYDTDYNNLAIFQIQNKKGDIFKFSLNDLINQDLKEVFKFNVLETKNEDKTKNVLNRLQNKINQNEKEENPLKIRR